ncbi:hypothetical protein E1I69_23175 [Bacillus timonensis]|uniref:Uncharacterized protein n=1 Tax=Bacillus timonensis TaxID=1033734 RepID=A0A4S3PJW0_9BACI|nr:hypothetical protein [Bacillus timonensis]THE09245.1 hypothetical protein E1I69_23175 [Bacillus timonensis]
MNKFDKEIDRFMTDYSKDHEEAIGKLDKWAAENEKGLRQLDVQARNFERELEGKMEKLDRWFSKKQGELEKKMGD